MGDGYITEGAVQIRTGKSADNPDVFYNPCQILNRDLSIAAIRSFSQLYQEEQQLKLAKKRETNSDATIHPNDEKITILEPLGASGIRSCRYAVELKDCVRLIICNDLDPTATAACVRNREINKIPPEVLRATCCDANQLASFGDAALLLQGHAQQDPGVKEYVNVFGKELLSELLGEPQPKLKLKQPSLFGDTHCHVVDLDPYGTAAPFLDSAIDRLTDGGMLCVTSTDMQVLAGKYPETCFPRYGGAQSNTAHAGWIHEMTLRLLLHRIASAAAAKKVAIVPLLSLSVDFYVRIFVQVRRKPEAVKHLSVSTALRIECSHCQCFTNIRMGNASLEGETMDEQIRRGRSFPGPRDSSGEGHPSYQPEGKWNHRVAAISPDEVASSASGLKCSCGRPDAKKTVTGPFWAAPLWNYRFLNLVIQNLETMPRGESQKKSRDKILGTLGVMRTELRDVPLYFTPRLFCKSFSIPLISRQKLGRAIRKGGYELSLFHRDPESVKTTAPIEYLHEVMRKYTKEQIAGGIDIAKDIKPPNFIREGLDEFEFSFDLESCFDKSAADEELELSPSKKRARFADNPKENWGPGARVKRQLKNPLLGLDEL